MEWLRWLYIEVILFYFGIAATIAGCLTLAGVIVWRMVRK